MPISSSLRRRVIQRAGERCEYCQIFGWPLTVDHVTPRSPRLRSPGGEADPTHDLDHTDNLAAACALCNRAKWNVTRCADPYTDLVQPLFNPRNQTWTDHFGWARDYTMVVGLTPIGRATLEQLQLNREAYLRQRRILRRDAGWWCALALTGRYIGERLGREVGPKSARCPNVPTPPDRRSIVPLARPAAPPPAH